MRFIDSGNWVAQFRFSASERETLTSLFSPRDIKRRQCCIAVWLDRAETVLELYFYIAEEQKTPLSEYRTRLKSIENLSRDLMQQLERLPEDCCESLSAEYLTVHRESNYRQFPTLQDSKPLLAESLRLLQTLANRQVSKMGELPAGENRDNLKRLVSNLMCAYFDIFGVWPPTTRTNPDTGFRVVLSRGVGPIIGRSIGKDLFDRLLSDLKK